MRVATRVWMVLCVLPLLAACGDHERSLTQTYGEGVISAQVVVGASMVNRDPAGIQVTLRGTGSTVTLSSDGRFTFASVPENAELQFTRPSDAINASLSLGRSSGSMVIEVDASGARPGRRRGVAPQPPLLQYEGLVVSVATDTLVVHDSHNQDVTFKVTEQTVIRKGGTSLTTADLSENDRVHVKAFTVNDETTAVEVMLQEEADTNDDDGDSEPTVTANGLVASKGDTDMVVQRANGEQVTVQVDGDTLIKKYGLPIDFAAINSGDHVECRGTRVDDTTMKAVQIQVENAPGGGGNGGNGHH